MCVSRVMSYTHSAFVSCRLSVWSPFTLAIYLRFEACQMQTVVVQAINTIYRLQWYNKLEAATSKWSVHNQWTKRPIQQFSYTIISFVCLCICIYIYVAASVCVYYRLMLCRWLYVEDLKWLAPLLLCLKPKKKKILHEEGGACSGGGSCVVIFDGCWLQ